MVTWDELHATTEGSQHIDWRSFFDERQLKEINFDLVYAKDFSHGTDGHNARLIIAKMAELLDLVQENVTFYGKGS